MPAQPGEPGKEGKRVSKHKQSSGVWLGSCLNRFFGGRLDGTCVAKRPNSSWVVVFILCGNKMTCKLEWPHKNNNKTDSNKQAAWWWMKSLQDWEVADSHSQMAAHIIRFTPIGAFWWTVFSLGEFREWCCVIGTFVSVVIFLINHVAHHVLSDIVNGWYMKV